MLLLDAGLALASSALFHGTNAMIFNIGTFPFMMMGANCLFLLDADAVELNPGNPEYKSADSRQGRCGLRPAGLCVAAGFACMQLLIPLRHLLYPGPVMWYVPSPFNIAGSILPVRRGQCYMTASAESQRHAVSTGICLMSKTGQAWGITVHG